MTKPKKEPRPTEPLSDDERRFRLEGLITKKPNVCHACHNPVSAEVCAACGNKQP